MTNLDLSKRSPRARFYAYTGLTAQARQLRRDGIDGPAVRELDDLAGGVRASLSHELDRDRAAHVRSLAAARKRRQRARQRGEDVPLRKPGPAPASHSEARSA